MPPEYSAVVYTGNNNDSELLKEFHLDPKKERAIRKSFTKLDQQPKILIVTEKLLTGFDAPVLYAMYLDKPMRDHTLLQASARVNRPYENEAEGMVKPHGFVLDFVGIFDKLEKALAFDSDEINAVVKDLKLLKVLFQSKMEEKAPGYLALIKHNFDDRDIDGLVEAFRDPARRKEFFREYKEIEMLYEIISPDKFLRPYLDNYATLSAIYQVVRKQYTKQVYVDRDFQKKTNEQRKKEQAEKGFDGLTFFVYRTLLDAKIEKTEEVSRKIKAAFVEFPNWKKSENALRNLRQQVTFAIYAQCDDLDQVTTPVDELFTLLEKADRI